MNQRAIGDGTVIDVGFEADEKDQQLDALRAEIRQLKRALSDAQVDADRAREDANRALSMLRRQLGPLYRALQAVFGELDAAGVTDGAADTPQAPQASPTAGGRDARELALWADWKTKLPPSCVKVVDALLLHPDLTVEQLKVACRMGRDSVYQATARLGQVGLINKNSGRFSLKAL